MTRLKLALAALGALLLMPIAAHAQALPDLGGKTVVVVTENAYFPLQFVDPKTSQPAGWEYDAMAELAKRLNFKVEYQNTSWDAMIQAVSDKQYDLGMTGITIKDDRKEKVDFSDPYMKSEIFMLVRGDESRFTDAKSFAADEKLLVGAQAGTSPFYVAVYEVLDGNEQNPAHQADGNFRGDRRGAEGRRRRSGAHRQRGGQGDQRKLRRSAEDDRRAAAGRRIRLHLPEGLRPRRADQRRHRRTQGGRHARQDHAEMVRRLQALSLAVS